MTEFWTKATHMWLEGTGDGAVKYAIFAVTVWALLYVVLAAVLSDRRIRPDNAPWRQIMTEFLVSMRSVGVFSAVFVIAILMADAGYLPLPALAAQWGPVWFGVSLIAMIVGHDAYFYWMHRILHKPRWFLRFHRRHHLSRNPTPFSAYSFDIGEAFAEAAFVPLWVMIFPTPLSAIAVFGVHQMIRNTLGHSNYELMPPGKDGRPLLDFMTTATHHNLHHQRGGYNYGLYFTWWDRWMGTEDPKYLARYAEAVRKRTKKQPIGATGEAGA